MSDSVASYYAYNPTKVAPIIFCVLFAVSTAFHIYQNITYKSWRVTGAVPWAGILFVAGFAIREASIIHPSNLAIYIVSIVFLLVAPPVYAAANYLTLGRALYYVPYLSPIHPGRVVTTFIGLDTVVAILTGSGAGRIANVSDPSQARLGSALIKASLLLQLGLFAAFIALVNLFHLRCAKTGFLPAKLRAAIYVLYASSALILVRNIFRTIDTWEGYSGYLETHEVFFYIFDGVTMLVNSVLLNVFHPARFLPQSNKIYLARDGVTELEGPGWIDKRHFLLTIFDPFDLGGLIQGRDKKETAFWEADGVGYRASEEVSPTLGQKRAG